MRGAVRSVIFSGSGPLLTTLFKHSKKYTWLSQAVHRPPKKNAELTFCESNSSLPEVPLGFLANYAQTSFS